MPTPPEPPKTFLERRPIRRAVARWYATWHVRHQRPFNFAIHLIGIPLALIVAPLLLFALPWDEWYWAAGAFVLGYVLQWTGHRVEGNDVGELIPLKRLLGLPVVAIAKPRGEPPSRAGE